MDKTRFRLGTLIAFLACSYLPVIGQNCVYPGETFLYVQHMDCGFDTDLCLDIPYADRNDYEIYLDGALYGGVYTPCNYDTTSVYSVSDLVNFPDPSPDFFLDSLIINGVIHSFAFASVNDLVDSMNVVDPGGSWTYDGPTRTIRGGLKGTNYSWLYVTETKSSTVIQQRIDFFILPQGLVIEIASGFYELVLNEIASACSDTLSLEVFCVNNENIVDTIELNQIDTLCFDLDDLRGSFNSITNICPDASGDFAMIDPIPGTNCIEITGVDLGLDSACLVIVDDLGLVDTIYYSVLVTLPDDPESFEANDDQYSTNINSTTTFNPTANDNYPNVLDTIFISLDPGNGTANVNPDGTITYVPDPGYESAGIPDSLGYTICIGLDCRTATIYVDVAPAQLEVMTAFTPNDDGINDTFVINNLDQYPTNELVIFNRWGNRVYQQEQYQNDWDGNWESSTTLPDGIYFYVLDVEINSQQEQIAGYVVIKR